MNFLRKQTVDCSAMRGGISITKMPRLPKSGQNVDNQAIFLTAFACYKENINMKDHTLPIQEIWIQSSKYFVTVFMCWNFISINY